MKHLKLIPFLVLLFVVAISCDDDDDAPVVINEGEIITNLTIELSNPGNTVTLTSIDLDGPDGPNAPVITIVGDLSPNTQYVGSIELLDASDPTDIEDITEEVEEEDLEHQFFFCVDNGLNASISGANLDSNGDVLGTTFTLTTGDASSGDLTFTLVHEGDKSANVDGCDTQALLNNGEIDISQTFTVTIQ